MKLLIVGGAGYVGTVIRPALEAEFECTHFDLKPVAGAEDRTIIADVDDDEKVSQAVAGMDGILYLAMGVGKKLPTCYEIDAAFDVNVRGLYRFCHHSLKADTKRFVYASTLSVYKNLWQQNRLVNEEVPPDAWDPYGMSKRVGEFMCQAAADEHPAATIIALRLMFPRNAADWPSYRYDRQLPSNTCALGPNDTQRLFVAAVNCDRPGFHVMQGTGDMEGQSCPTNRAHQVLGWAPQNE